MSNHFKLKNLGIGTNGSTIWLIKTIQGHYGILNGKEILFRDEKDALGYGAHCVDPNSKEADGFWKSRTGLLSH